jgi:hypothetical protein
MQHGLPREDSCERTSWRRKRARRSASSIYRHVAVKSSEGKEQRKPFLAPSLFKRADEIEKSKGR